MTETAQRDDLLERLKLLETGQVSDVLDEMGIVHHALSSSLSPLSPGCKTAGRAACARGRTVVNLVNATPALPADTLERLAAPDTILVVETGGFTAAACIGGFVAYSLQRGGCRGFLTDGAVRDVEEINGYGFPVFTAAVSPVNGARRWSLVEADVPVSLPGAGAQNVTIAPGDLILADADGIVVIPADVEEQAIRDSEKLKQIEEQIGKDLRNGGSRAEVMKANPRFAHIQRAQR